MPLTAGARLGPYEITSPIGAGVQGEVYKAKDTRLDRTVAIKVLPSHLSDHDELRQRFEQEARAVSSLNHPNICTLHDIGRENGVDFIVMEYVEGETLAKQLERGPLTWQEAVRYGIELSDALDKAHRAGVVHRRNRMWLLAGCRRFDHRQEFRGVWELLTRKGLMRFACGRI